MNSLSGPTHPVGTALALTAAALTTLWFTRVTWAHWLGCALAVCLGLPQRQKSNVYLKGVYKPVDKEEAGQNLEVVGYLPHSLSGVFARVGPNPYFPPIGDYHMYVHHVRLHSCRQTLVWLVVNKT